MRQLLDDLWRDLRHAVRGIARAPGFAAAVILTLGLGIGANAAMFGVIDRLMFRPYPLLRAPGEVHRLYLRYSDGRREYTNSYIEYTRYLDLRRWTTTFAELAAFADREMAVGEGATAQERRVAMVSAQFFSFFDAPPALGRFFTPAEDEVPRGADVAVLGHEIWRTEFGGRDVRGTLLRVGSMRMTIIGVAPKGFEGVTDGNSPDVYVPITAYAHQESSVGDAGYYTRYEWSWFETMARRKPGVTVAQAEADLTQAYRKSWEAEKVLFARFTPQEIARPTGIVAPLRYDAGPERGLESRTALWVSGVALIVLLIACANVANLFLARALRRRRETAVRVALGVERGRLVRQVLTDGIVYAFLGGVMGLLVAAWGGALVRWLLYADLMGEVQADLRGNVFTDPRTLVFAVLIATATGLLTGLVPAILTARADLSTALKSGAREGTYQRSRTRTALLIAQVALSFVLLVGAGLFVRSLRNVEAMRIGFDADPILLVERNLRGIQLDDSASVRLTRTMLEAAQAYPGVEAAAAVSSVPFWSTSSTSLFVTGIDSVHKLGRFTYQTSTPDYFRASGTRILRGRGLLDEDRAGTPRVVVVSEGMAGILWPGQDAIGQCVRIGADTMPCTTVVGIAEDIVQQSLSETQRFQYYLPVTQQNPMSAWALFVRVRGDVASQQEGIRLALQQLLPGEAYVRTRRLGDLVRRQQGAWRLGAMLFGVFGVLALVVAAVGLYSVIAYTVEQRMHELGVRIALGAEHAHILLLVVGQSVRFSIIGIAVGVGLAALAGRWVEPLLFQQSARDPLVFAAVTVVLIAVTLAASAAPAWRAIRADPAAALRSD